MWFLVDVWREQPAPCQLEDDVAVNEHEAVVLHWGHLGVSPPIRTRTTSLQCCGAENMRFFSHACGLLYLQLGFLVAGEMWIFSTAEV